MNKWKVISRDLSKNTERGELLLSNKDNLFYYHFFKNKNQIVDKIHTTLTIYGIIIKKIYD